MIMLFIVSVAQKCRIFRFILYYIDANPFHDGFSRGNTLLFYGTVNYTDDQLYVTYYWLVEETKHIRSKPGFAVPALLGLCDTCIS